MDRAGRLTRLPLPRHAVATAPRVRRDLVSGFMQTSIGNGYYTLPAGRIANAVTWLDIRPTPRPASPSPWTLEPLRGPDAERFLALYGAVGTPWLWSGRPQRDDGTLAADLDRPDVHAFAATGDGADWGILELGVGKASEMEIVYFGVRPDLVGRGRGRWLMERALDFAAALGIGRLWLHTCNFDHPAALSFYRAMGFGVFAQGFEIMDDPRATGELPRDCAPHVPFLDADAARRGAPSQPPPPR